MTVIDSSRKEPRLAHPPVSPSERCRRPLGVSHQKNWQARVDIAESVMVVRGHNVTCECSHIKTCAVNNRAVEVVLLEGRLSLCHRPWVRSHFFYEI
jgi:hypothetical protein